MYTSNIQTKPNQTAENYALYTCVCRWKTMLTNHTSCIFYNHAQYNMHGLLNNKSKFEI